MRINNAYIVDGINKAYLGNLNIEDGLIKEVNSGLSNDEKAIDLKGNYILSGMIDIHLHGAYGYDFIREPKVSIENVAKRLYKEGTTSFLASLTVISHSDLCDLLKEYSQTENKEYQSKCLGVHSEGPFLSYEYKALMDERYLRDFNLEELKEMYEASGGKLKVMTIAPELKGFDEILEYCRIHNIKLMIGHSNATCKEASDAISKGCVGFTHLYNAMSQHTHRRPGIVTSALLNTNAYSELIVDGFHIDRDVIKATYQILGSDKIILITDAMLGRGMDDGEYVFSKLRCKKVYNTVRVIETGRIAGSAISQLDAIKNIKEFTGCSIEDIAKMTSLNPSKLLGIDDKYGSIEVGKVADLIVLDKNLNLLSTYIDGKCVYKKGCE